MIGEIIGPKEFNVGRGYERTFHMLVSSHNWDDCIPFITFGKDFFLRMILPSFDIVSLPSGTIYSDGREYSVKNWDFG